MAMQRRRDRGGFTIGGGVPGGRAHVLRCLLGLALTGAAAGCGGGGGGGGTGARPASFFETAEYNASYGLDAVGASSAYAAGATGRDVTVAVIDTGIDVDHPEFAGAIAAGSTDIISGNPAFLDDVHGHGTAVAGILAARRNQALGHGVAFQSRLLALRADAGGSCGNGGCAFDHADVAAATDYAVTQGAAVINYSLGGATSLEASLDGALARAADAGVVLVLSAGNAGAAEPTFPARFAADPAADGLAIAVGAVGPGNQIASFSNRAGSAREHYLVAPGVQILAPDLVENGGAGLVSGTSFAAPHVSGAAALVLEAAPFLSAAQVVELLLDSATDLGDPGTDPIYGRGLVNLAAALGPQGPLSVPLGRTVDEAGAALASSGLQLGPAFGPGPDLGTAIFLDGYGRPYWLDLADRVGAPASGPDLHGWLAEAPRTRSLTVPLGRRLGLGVAVSEATEEGLLLGDWQGHAGTADDAFMLELTTGELVGGGSSGLAVVHGLGLQQRFGLSSVDPTAVGGLLSQRAFASPYLALADRGDGLVVAQKVADGVALRVGLVTSEAERQVSLDSGGNRVVVGELVRSWPTGSAVGLQVGSVDERQSLLDTSGGGALGLPDGATTTFLGVTGRLALTEGLALFGQGSLGLTRPEDAGQGLLDEVSTLRSSSFALGLAGRDLLTAGDRLILAVAQPLRVDAGSAMRDRPVGRSFDGRILRQTDRVDLAPEGREVDVELSYRLALSARRELGFNWLTQLEPGHQRSAAPAHAIAIRLQAAF